MKNRLIILLAALTLSASVPVQAQSSDKELKKDLKQRVDADSKKSAKRLAKEGWQIIPGKLPMERQIRDSRYAELSKDESGKPSYFIGSHQAVGGNYSAAKQICDSRAYAEIAQQVGTSVARIVKDQLSSRNLGEEDLELVDETLSATKSVISARLTGIKPTLEIYRNLDGGKVEFRVVIAAPYAETIKIAKSVLLPEIKQKSEKLAKEVDALL